MPEIITLSSDTDDDEVIMVKRKPLKKIGRPRPLTAFEELMLERHSLMERKPSSPKHRGMACSNSEKSTGSMVYPRSAAAPFTLRADSDGIRNYRETQNDSDDDILNVASSEASTTQVLSPNLIGRQQEPHYIPPGSVMMTSFLEDKGTFKMRQQRAQSHIDQAIAESESTSAFQNLSISINNTDAYQNCAGSSTNQCFPTRSSFRRFRSRPASPHYYNSSPQYDRLPSPIYDDFSNNSLPSPTYDWQDATEHNSSTRNDLSSPTYDSDSVIIDDRDAGRKSSCYESQVGSRSSQDHGYVSFGTYRDANRSPPRKYKDTKKHNDRIPPYTLQNSRNQRRNEQFRVQRQHDYRYGSPTSNRRSQSPTTNGRKARQNNRRRGYGREVQNTRLEAGADQRRNFPFVPFAHQESSAYSRERNHENRDRERSNAWKNIQVKVETEDSYDYNETPGSFPIIIKQEVSDDDERQFTNGNYSPPDGVNFNFPDPTEDERHPIMEGMVTYVRDMLSTFEAQSNCSLEILPKGVTGLRWIRVTGTPKDVLDAKEMINDWILDFLFEKGSDNPHMSTPKGSICIDVPMFARDFVCGKRGEKLKRMERGIICNDFRGSTVEQSPPIQLHGNLEKVQSTYKEIMNMIRKETVKQQNKTKVTLKVPNAAVGGIMGRKGTNIRQISSQFNTDITLRPDSYPSTGHRLFDLVGQFDDIQKAMAHIQTYVNDCGACPEDEGVFNIQVPSESVGRLIGKNGTKLKWIRERSGAKVNLLSENENGNALVECSGGLIEAEFAKYLVQVVCGLICHTRPFVPTDCNNLSRVPFYLRKNSPEYYEEHQLIGQTIKEY